MCAAIATAEAGAVQSGRAAGAELPLPGRAELAHLPGPNVRWSLPNTVRFLADPLGAARRNYEAYGPVFRNLTLGTWRVALFGPEANELVLLDRDKIFSSEHGWGEYIARLFPRGLMLMDFEEHRTQRKTMSVAFKSEAMQNYTRHVNAGVRRTVSGWSGPMLFHPAAKQLTLELAATSFLGISWGAEAERIKHAFIDMVQASVGVVRRPIPGSKMWRGVRGRKFMCSFFAREIPKRRAREADDIFSQICNATDENGELMSDRAIIDHMNFLMMSAHDTLTSSLSSTAYFLALHPEWQERLREEILAVRQTAGDDLPYDRLGELKLVEMAFKEVLRLHPSVPAIPRRALREFEFAGYRIPAGTFIGVNPLITHRMADLWPEPDRFDPTRFEPEAVRERHKYAWVPFGGGSHACIGLHFAHMQSKVFLFHLLSRYRLKLEDGYQAKWRMWPMPKPRDGLPMHLEPLSH